MIKLTLKILLFIPIILLLLTQVEKFFFKDHFYRDTINQYQASDKNFDIVFFGNSHSHSSFDPRVFEIEIGAKSINLGSPAQRLVTTKVVIDMVMNTKKPTLAVVNIFSLSLNETGNEKYKAFQLETLDFLPNTSAKLKTIMKMFPANEWVQAFSKTVRFHSNWDNRSNINNAYEYARNYDTYKGFVTYKTSYDSLAYAKFEKKFGNRDTPITHLSELEKQRIDDIIAQFDDHNVPVLFVNAPDYAYDISDNFRTYALEIGKYLKKRGQTLVDFNEVKEEIGLMPKHFRDPNHLNTKGAIVVSEYLATYIAQNYEINKRIEPEILAKNRYAIVASDYKTAIQNVRFNQQDSTLFGLKGTYFYQTGNKAVEIIFDINEEHFENFKIISQFGNKKDQSLYKKIRSWTTFEKKDIIRYQNKSFVVLTLYPEENELFDLQVHVNNKNRREIFSIDYFNLNQ